MLRFIGSSRAISIVLIVLVFENICFRFSIRLPSARRPGRRLRKIINITTVFNKKCLGGTPLAKSSTGKSVDVCPEQKPKKHRWKKGRTSFFFCQSSYLLETEASRFLSLVEMSREIVSFSGKLLFAVENGSLCVCD